MKNKSLLNQVQYNNKFARSLSAVLLIKSNSNNNMKPHELHRKQLPLAFGALLITLTAQLLLATLHAVDANHLHTLISTNNVLPPNEQIISSIQPHLPQNNVNLTNQVETLTAINLLPNPPVSSNSDNSSSSSSSAEVNNKAKEATVIKLPVADNADSSANLKLSTTEDSIMDFTDTNFLNLPSGSNSLSDVATSEDGVDSLSSSPLSSLPEEIIPNNNNWSATNIRQPVASPQYNTKSKRQAQIISNADWWTKVSTKQHQTKQHNSKGANNSTEQPIPTSGTKKKTHPLDIPKGVRVGGKNKSGAEVGGSTKRTPAYKEQPFSQNIIMTIKNQLIAIKGKHRLLVTRSVKQLQQLDNKLTESYKLCMKKQQPLYAGMLYRTRDFVVRMAKEVKHESKVLEAMTKQVQNVLRQKMTNRTIVKEYNRMIATTTTTESSLREFQTEQQVVRLTTINKTNTGPSRIKKDSTSLYHQLDTQQQQVDNSLTSQNIDTVTPTSLNNLLTGKKAHKSGSKKGHSTTSQSKQPHVTLSKTHISSLVKERELESTTKKPAQKKYYTVSVNEVNLKKELTKTQALIDRINGSCYDLSAVVDDIVHWFEYTANHTNKKGFFLMSKVNKMDKMYHQQEEMYGLSNPNPTDQKRYRKMLKSPVRLFLEKYGKMTIGNFENNLADASVSVPLSNNTTNSETNTVNLPEMRQPLFENPNLSYSDSSDLDTGFDYIMSDSG